MGWHDDRRTVPPRADASGCWLFIEVGAAELITRRSSSSKYQLMLKQSLLLGCHRHLYLGSTIAGSSALPRLHWQRAGLAEAGEAHNGSSVWSPPWCAKKAWQVSM
jgi:hypothetical protein